MATTRTLVTTWLVATARAKHQGRFFSRRQDDEKNHPLNTPTKLEKDLGLLSTV